MMGSEAENESSYTLKLPLLSVSHAQIQSPERSGMLTSPFYASASVPFRWEEEPGKPKPCTALISLLTTRDESSQKCLELPPRLLSLDFKVTEVSSPTTVLEGPYMGRSKFQSSSFRMGSECYGSFRSAASDDSPEMGQLGSMVLSKRGYKEKGFLGSWRRRRALKASPRDNYVFAESECSRDRGGEDNNVKNKRIRRIGSFLSVSRSKSRFWESIYEGLMQVVPWSNREKKDMIANR